jgi:arabinose-5-phosphate isomerase
VTTPDEFIKTGKQVIATELEAVSALSARIDKDFARACDLLLHCEGRVVVVGIGKSGHIGRKIAATLASTGTPAFFVHPAEASHGDLGMIMAKDVVLMISNSGTTAEMVPLLAFIKRMGAPIVSMTGNPSSPMAQESDVHLLVSVTREACPLDLAPTSSTTVTLVMGDALAIALLEARGFSAEDFAFSHPGGALGKRLLTKVRDVMRSGSDVPMVHQETLLSDALLEVTQKGMGMTTVVDDKGVLLGIFTDGDLRRALDQDLKPRETRILDAMTPGGLTVRKDMMAAEALHIMQAKSINHLVVVDGDGKPEGALNMHDMLRHGIA